MSLAPVALQVPAVPARHRAPAALPVLRRPALRRPVIRPLPARLLAAHRLQVPAVPQALALQVQVQVRALPVQVQAPRQVPLQAPPQVRVPAAVRLCKLADKWKI